MICCVKEYSIEEVMENNTKCLLKQEYYLRIWMELY